MWYKDDGPSYCFRCKNHVPDSAPFPGGMCVECDTLVKAATGWTKPVRERYSHKPTCPSLPLPFREPGECTCGPVEEGS